jgi:phytoene desaturase
MANEGRRLRGIFPCLQKSYSSWTSLLSRSTLAALPRMSLGRTVFDILRGYFGNDDLALAFSFQSKYLGMSAWECPGFFSMLAYIEYAYGVWHVRGGLSEISTAMAKVATGNGAEIRLGAEVERLLLHGRRVTGVRLTDGEEISCDDVVLNADFAWSMTHLVPPGMLRRWSPDTLQGKKFSCSTFMLYLGLDRTFDLPHHTIYFADDYRRNVDDIFKRGRLSDDTSLYVRNAGVSDPTLAPPGHSAIYILVPVPNCRAAIDWQQETPRFRNLVLATWRRRAGLPDIEPHIRVERILAPPDWENDYHVHLGATFNLAHNIGQMIYWRPHNQFEELDDCYLVGGGTHPGSGLPTIYESGRITANLISRKHGVPYESFNRYA